MTFYVTTPAEFFTAADALLRDAIKAGRVTVHNDDELITARAQAIRNGVRALQGHNPRLAREVMNELAAA